MTDVNKSGPGLKPYPTKQQFFDATARHILSMDKPSIRSDAEHDVAFNDDVHIKRGDKILMNFPAANHDPEMFDRADEVVIDRERNRTRAILWSG